MSPRTVRLAHRDEAATITEILATAFMDDPISIWIFPDRAVRQRLHPEFFEIFVTAALEAGQIFTTTELDGAAMWLDVDPSVSESPAEHEEFLSAFDKALGEPYAERFATLDAVMAKNHPTTEAHAYLPFIGVRPNAQGHGVGAALLNHRLAELDAQRRPAYLEASSHQNSRLYALLGFRPIGNPVTIPAGPEFHPMWRPASSASRP